LWKNTEREEKDKTMRRRGEISFNPPLSDKTKEVSIL